MIKKESRTIGKSMKETRDYHSRYLKAINNPLRRKILRTLKEGSVTIANLKSSTGLDITTLNWHLSILEHGFCVKKDIKRGKIIYSLTQEGSVVNYLD